VTFAMRLPVTDAVVARMGQPVGPRSLAVPGFGLVFDSESTWMAAGVVGGCAPGVAGGVVTGAGVVSGGGGTLRTFVITQLQALPLVTLMRAPVTVALPSSHAMRES